MVGLSIDTTNDDLAGDLNLPHVLGGSPDQIDIDNLDQFDIDLSQISDSDSNVESLLSDLSESSISLCGSLGNYLILDTWSSPTSSTTAPWSSWFNSAYVFS